MRQRVEFLKERAEKKNNRNASSENFILYLLAFVGIFTARIFSALYNNISDCDETFNYWEPVHYLVHGHGFQTWEYSPAYAIRSYAYLYTIALPLWFINKVFTSNKVVQFYIIRCLKALASSFFETYFLRSVSRTHSKKTIFFFFIFSLISPAFYISSTAFLPSSFSMYACMCAYAYWWLNHSVFVPVFLVGLASIYGWPFAAIIGIPLAMEMVLQHKKLYEFVLKTLLSAFLLLLPLVLIDSYYYGKFSIPPLNILLYNVFTQHGPDLYGTEPWTFYFINCFLNFNIAFVFLLFSFPVFLFLELPKLKFKQILDHEIFSSLLVTFLWIVVFFTRPHKEERFIFPIYPFMALCAAWALQRVSELLKRFIPKMPLLLTLLVSTCFVVLSLCRILALYHGYNGVLRAYSTFSNGLHDDQTVKSVCVGKEWYRFPSHFFLPQGHHLKFLRSEFKGQLPGEFSRGPDATKILPPYFNHLNKEQVERYVDIESCDYLVDLSTSHHTALEPAYYLQTDKWKVLVEEKFLDASRSTSLFRAFYIPFFSLKNTYYVPYHVFVKRKTTEV